MKNIYKNLITEKRHFKILKYKSDDVNSANNKKIQSSILAKFFPLLDRSIMVICQK